MLEGVREAGYETLWGIHLHMQCRHEDTPSFLSGGQYTARYDTVR